MIKISDTMRNRLERIYLFARTDYHLRYYGSKLGIIWAFLNPMFKILIYYVVFSTFIFGKRDPDFILYLFTGVISWGFFSETTNSSILLFQKQRAILQNVKLPKVDFFFSMALSKFYGYLVNLVIYFLFALIFFQPDYSWNLLYLIPILLGYFMLVVGVSFILATLYLYIRDLDHLWSIIILAGFWSVPVIWDYRVVLKNVPILKYNPVTGYLASLRDITLGNIPPNAEYFGWAFLSSIVIFLVGYRFMTTGSKKALEVL